MLNYTFSPILFLAVSIPIIAFGALVMLFSLRALRTDDLNKRLNEFVAEKPADDRLWLRNLTVQTRGLTGSILNRVIVPWFKGVGRILGRATPAGMIESIERKLLIAGNPFGLSAREYFGIELGLIVLGSWLSFIFISRRHDLMGIGLAVVPVLLGYLLPRVWLDMRVRGRQNKIRRGLPDSLDMLSVCVSAGLGFDQSLKRVSEYWNTPIGLEFARVISEMEMGISRKDALRNLADRIEVTELSSFVAFIIQTEQLGMSITDTLHAQADQMRVERRFKAQEQAQRIPTKMLFPMVFLIFPALLAIILGPAVPMLLNFLTTFGR
jgi:tight adherence protein C